MNANHRIIGLAIGLLLCACATTVETSGTVEVPAGRMGGIRNTSGTSTTLRIENLGPGEVLSVVGDRHGRQLFTGDSVRVRLESGQVVNLRNDSGEPARLEYTASVSGGDSLSVSASVPLPDAD